MNHLDIAKKEGRERFDKVVDQSNDIVQGGYDYNSLKSLLSSHERAIEIALLKDLVEEAEGMKIGYFEEDYAYDKLKVKYQDRIKKLQ